MQRSTDEHRDGRVMVCDGDTAARASVAMALRGAGFEVQELDSGRRLLEAARTERPLAVVLEVDLRVVCGYEVCWTLRQEFGPSLPLVFVSRDRTEPRDRIAGLLLGADDYLAKPCDAGELTARVRGLLRRAAPSNGRAHRLTARELDVVRLLAVGEDQRDIAEELVISPKTVASHLENIFKKLGVRSRAQVVAVAYQEGLVDPEPSPLASAG
jgi:DNA-binding NarL/FixJ family response regulator